MFAKKIMFLLVFFLLICITNTYGATIQGTIYNYNLDIVEDALIEVNSVPKQVLVAKDGTYSFDLPVGEYVINASYIENYKKYTFRQEIIIQDEGEYAFDLIFFPDISEVTDILDEDIDIPEAYEDEANPLFWYLLIVLLMAVIIILIILFRIKKRKKKGLALEGEDLVKEILDFVKKEGGRATQKDIRRNFPVSEAKISLVITELEDEGVVKKIKRGRGNIVILIKK